MDPQRLERVRAASRKYVDSGGMPFSQTLVAHHGSVVFRDSYGWADIEGKVPIKDDSIIRLYSMTKPVACVAAMMCYERGHFQMEEPVELHLPEFKGMKVWEGGKMVKPRHRPNIKQLFMHTAGIGTMPTSKEHSRILRQTLGPLKNPPKSLEEHVKRIASAPLLFHPGERWNYSSCHTVLGRLVEVWTRTSFGEFLHDNMFAPLRMVDTGFLLPEVKRHRLAHNYGVRGGLQGPARQVANAGHYGAGAFKGLKDISSGTDDDYGDSPSWMRDNGSGGLVGTIDDYFKFAQCLLDNLKGRASHGVRLLGRKTAELMTMNHSVPSQKPVWGAPGIGFGLGCAVCVDPTRAAGFCTAGEFWWGGAASTLFWVDPAEETVCVNVTQLMPSDFWPLRVQLRVAVNQALIDAPPATYSPSTASVAARL